MAAAAKSLNDTGSSVRFLACLADEVTREAASRAAAQLGWAHSIVRSGGIDAAMPLIDPAKPPTLLLVDIAEAPDPVSAVGDLIAQCGSGTHLITIGSVNDVTLFRQLTALGVADYLVKPVSSELLSEAFQQALRGQSETTSVKRRARFHTFIGARGGVGTTTLALSTAWLLMQEHKTKAALVDLDLHFGNIALSLDLEPARGLRQALEHPERTDGLLLASAIVKSDENLPILAAEESLHDMMSFASDSASVVLAAMANDFDALIVDVPRALDGASRQVLATADNLVIVTDLSLAALRDAFRIADLAKTLGNKEAPIFVANQVGATHRGEIGRSEFERGLGAPLDYVIPFDPKAARQTALNGKPFPAADKTSKATVEMKRLAARLSGREEKPKRGLKRWFG